jgi:hypothetical protein
MLARDCGEGYQEICLRTGLWRSSVFLPAIVPVLEFAAASRCVAATRQWQLRCLINKKTFASQRMRRLAGSHDGWMNRHSLIAEPFLWLLLFHLNTLTSL